MITLKKYLKLSDDDKNSAIAKATELSDITEREFNSCINNHGLLDAFFIEAHRVAHRKHYSAYTIVEVLRFNSDTNDDSQDVFKIANEMKPVLARVSMELFPALNGLFKTKKRG
jgi:hypothetical protein